MSSFDKDCQEMLDVYLLETGQLTGKLEKILLESEKTGRLDPEDINSIFRIMHTMKSSSAMMGLTGLSSMNHRLEDLFCELRDRPELQNRDNAGLFELLFAVSDFINAETGKMKNADYTPSDVTEMIERVEAYISGETAEPEKAVKTEGVYFKVFFEPDCKMENIRALMLMRRVRAVCPEAECCPDNLESDPEAETRIRQDGFLVHIAREAMEEVYTTIVQGMFVKSCELISERPVLETRSLEEPVVSDLVSEPEEKKQNLNSETSEKTQSVENEFINVRMDRLDSLQYLTGELTVLASLLSNELGQSGKDGLEERYMYQFRHMLSEFGNTVLKMRMVPIARIVPKLRRIVRDICKDQDKEVDFLISGQEMEADKNIIDQIYEASMHIIRNSVDHGIEPPHVRRALGKPENGTIRFEAKSSGEELSVSITDDGKGIALEKIREKARERKLFTKPEKEYTPEELYEFTMMPGFTTNDEASEYSGRGVGMDIVKQLIENAGGHIKIESEEGKGTEVSLYLPLNHSIINSTVLSAGGHLFSIPFSQVLRFFEYTESDPNIRTEKGHTVYLQGKKVLPVIDVAHVYRPGEKCAGKVMIHIKGVSAEACILADSVIGHEKLVLKPLPRLLGTNFKHHTGMSGCSIMGDGSVCMALDVESFIKYAQEKVYGRRRDDDGK